MVVLRSNSVIRTRQEARDAFQQLLPPTKIIHDDLTWEARSCQFHSVAHALEQVNYPNPPPGMHLRARCKTWLRENYALVSPFLTNTSEAEWKQRCKNYGWAGSNTLPGDQFTLMAMATELRCNINVYQGFHPVIQSPLGGVEALYDIDICLITDIHYMSIVTADQEEQIHDDLDNEVPEVDDILGDGMARPEAAGGFVHDIVEIDEGSEIAHSNALESAFVPSDASVITDATCQNDEASTMGCGGHAQFGQHPAETAGSGTDIALNSTGNERNTLGGDGNAFEQPANGVPSPGVSAADNNDAEADADADAEPEPEPEPDADADADADSHFDARTCDICKLPNASASFLLCDECNTGYHTYCLQPALPSVPEGQWVCPPCSDRFFKIDGSSEDDYLAWLDRHSLVSVLGEQVIYRPEPGARGRNMRGTFILPPPDKFDAFCAELQRLERARRVAEGEAPGPDITFDICVRTPYVIEYTNGSLELLTAAEASLLLPDNPPLQIEVPQGPAPVIQLDVGHSPFESVFPQGSWGEILQKAGAFKFLTSKALNGELYELRDYPMPTSSPPPAVHGEMRDALEITARLCTTFREESFERLTLRIIGKQIFPHLIFAQGTRVAAVQAAIKKFRQGKWESLWKMAMTKAEQLRVKRDKHPNQPRARTDTQKDAYAQKCAKAGNLSKANQTICSELIPSCDENTLPQLQSLHPPGDLNFNRQFWPEEQAIRDYWASAEGQEVVDKHFSLKKIRQYFRNRKPLAAADVDGWRGREHLAWMFMNNDTEFQELIRKEFLLPYLTNEFLEIYAKDNAGGLLFAFLKANGRLRPLVCGDAWRRCIASLIAQFLKLDAAHFFTSTFPNFIQCAGGLRDGATICAQTLQTLVSAPVPDDEVNALLNIDLRNAFNEANRHAGFDALLGKASRTYDDGQVQIGDQLPHLASMHVFFLYFKAMHQCPSTLRYTDHKGTVHHIEGTTGGQQGDPLEMLRFCLTIHPIWGRVMTRNPQARAVAFADDGFVYDSLTSVLHIWVQLSHAFKNDADLAMQLGKCRLLVQGNFTREEARAKVLQIIDGDDALSSLRPLIAEVDGPNDVIQVDGITGVGVPIGSPDFVQQFVATKASEIIRDVDKVQVVTDPLIHFHLLRFCQNTRMAYINRSVPPEVMAAGPCNLQHVDEAIVKAILGRGTKLTHEFGSSSEKWSTRAFDWYSSIVQKACHRGGLGITPNAASSISAYYSATAQYVSWVHQLPNTELWAGGQDLTQHDSWTAPNLLALKDTHARLLSEYQCVEVSPDVVGDAAAQAPDAAEAPVVTLLLPPLNLLATMQNSSEEEGNTITRPPQPRITSQIMRNWAPHLTAAANSVSTRSTKVNQLHQLQRIRAKVAAPASILGDDMPDNEDDNAQRAKHFKWAPPAFITCLSSLQHDTVMTFPFDWWTSWFCQFLGIDIPALTGPHRLCNCGRFVLDALGDHSHTCSQHSGSTKDAHEHILSAVEKVVKRAGFTTRRRNVTSSRGGQKGDLQIQNINLAGRTHLVIDVACVHDFSGDCWRDVRRNGQLRFDDPDMLLNNAADAKVRKYREAYAAPDRLLAFLPAIMSTSGRIHGEFLRLLHILSHRQAVNFFELFGEEPTDNAFTFRRAAYFFHNRATIGLACAQATAMRTHVAPHTIRPLRAPPPPHAYDPLLLLSAPARAS